ncbi:twin-arginine translocase subunit TatC [Actinoplanes sp. NPDC051343]|uniref:twin-arginine translocase subunit TatC n=1 Tax=Actinoplanes sp. NPDC051343 TaxID=3363906 RepID=UPI0037999C9C
MALSLSRRTEKQPSQFERASDGSMSLMDHVRELRSRLFIAAIGLVVGLIVGFIVSKGVFDILSKPYCTLPSSQGVRPNGTRYCDFVVLGVGDPLVVRLKVALWVGLFLGSPVWLYQLWAFVAPGLHRHERKWAYIFAGIAAPLFIGGGSLAYFMIFHSLPWIMDAGVLGQPTKLEVSAYLSFVTNMILLFGCGFEFPLLLMMLNFTGVLSARKLLSWWRVVVFLCFAFAAIATPDPGPFGMTALAAAMSLLYFIAVGVAWLNDRRKGRGKEMYAGLDDDQISPLADERVSVGAADPIEPPTPVSGPGTIDGPTPVERPRPLDNRFDDMT